MSTLLKTTNNMSRTSSKIDIYNRVYMAIVEHRLPPGTKLPEEKIAELFGVSRTQVRGVLQRLSVEQLVTLVPNKSAFVSTPTVDDAKDVLNVRKTLEPSVIQRLVESIKEGKANTAVAHLRELIRMEQQAHANEDHRSAVRLSGEFHVALAALTGSKLLERLIRELTPLTCLAILTFNAPLSSACPNDEHTELVDAIEAGDVKTAVTIMSEHLSHIEDALHLDREEVADIDLADVLLA